MRGFHKFFFCKTKANKSMIGHILRKTHVTSCLFSQSYLPYGFNASHPNMRHESKHILIIASLGFK